MPDAMFDSIEIPSVKIDQAAFALEYIYIDTFRQAETLNCA